MNAAEQALLAGLSAELKSALKSFLRDGADKELPALLAVEEARLPDYAQPVVAGVVGMVYPKLQAVLDAKIDAL